MREHGLVANPLPPPPPPALVTPALYKTAPSPPFCLRTVEGFHLFSLRRYPCSLLRDLQK